jgi:hypothetical protein
VRVANGQAFWGDSILGPVTLVQGGPLDYLTLDYLAEVTMSILQKAKERDAGAGYAKDFLGVVERVLPRCVQANIKIIANAGGVNPAACAEAVAEVVRKLGLAGVRVGVVEGDDILGDLESLVTDGEALANMDTGQPLASVLDRVRSANVYLGAAPIVDALRGGADIVITGRCADASLTVAPLVHEFGWTFDDYDRLAAATVAGHIIECGTQCTGGNFTGWRDVPDMANIGYPIVEASADGSFVVTKHDGTGGLVNVDTVTAQLLYEIGDPSRYLTPDVTADFTTVSLRPDGLHRVHVDGVRGSPATDMYKVSVGLHDGYKAVGKLVVPGPDALEKAQLAAAILFARLKRDGVVFGDNEHLVEYLGAGACFDGIVTPPVNLPEVVLRVAVRHDNRRVVDRFGAELASLATSGPPGLTGYGAGRPKASEIISFWPALLPKHHIRPSTRVEAIA